MKLSYPTKHHFFYIFIATFCIRAFVFYFYVQHNERYRQADTMDYHNCAIGIAYGTGMHRADNLKPIFWRTPGYPLLLAATYKVYGMNGSPFDKNHDAHMIFLWLQMLLCSLTPIILFLLAYMLTANLLIAYLLALIAMVHPGFILASMYLLTEGIAIMFFYLFLLFFYRSFSSYGEQKNKNTWWHSLIYAGIALAAYTWMRPMGEFVLIVALLLLCIASVDTWHLKLQKCLLFFSVFGLCVLPWYVRNYNLTGKWFFCPMSGAYLNTFTAPKIVRAVNHIPLEKAIGICYQLAIQETKREAALLQNRNRAVPRELIAKRIAWPVLLAHPFIAAKEWMQEVIKTTFDLYSYQLAALAAGTFSYDPIEEFLPTKIYETLWQQPMPCTMRIIAWLELLFTLLMWIGLLGGFWLFMVQCFFKKGSYKKINGLWIKVAPLIWAVLFMTGGFGYARLRLPIEPLMIILALTWWMYIYQNDRKDAFCKNN